MRNLLLFVLAATVAVGCSQESVDELTNTPAVEGRSLVVSLDEEGDETRIQLNEDFKTVWNEGDLVSVFYRSTVNEQWQFQGKTGDRTGNILPVDSSIVPPATGNDIVVVYPYNDGYFYNSDTKNIQATLPTEQTYLKDSYGLDGNIMVSSSEYNQITLKSVCGWLKLQLTGNGEQIKSITVRGNSGEQVAGELYINTADATSTLASQLTESDDDSEVSGTLVRPGTILTEVTLNCLDGTSPTEKGVALGAEATSFYIALPPQTFAKGLNVEITAVDGSTMTKSTDKEVVIERNHIKPMTAFGYNGVFKPANNEIYYTNGSTTEPTAPNNPAAFGDATIQSNSYDVEEECWVITFDKVVTEIGNGAFYCCTSLTSVTIPDSVTTIGNSAFYGCDSLTSVTIPDSVITIGKSVFLNCDSLKEFKGKFVADNGRCLIKDNTIIAYANASGTTYTIPDSVTTIGYGAFYYCDSLKSVTIPDSVTTIGDYAFYYCTSLKTVYCKPTTPPTGGNRMFDSNASDRKIYVPASDDDSIINAYKAKQYWSNYKNYIFEEEPKPANNEIWYTNGSTTEPTVPYVDNIDISSTFGTSIESNTYDAAKRCWVMSFYGDLTKIGNNAFKYCDTLTSIILPNSIKTIGDSAFHGCYNIATLNIPEGVTSIGQNAFKSCQSLTSVTIPDSVTSIGVSAFETCDDIKEFKGKYATDNGRCLVKDNTIIAYAEASGTTYTIPNGVTTIGDNVFLSCTKLTSVVIPNGVTTIKSGAFYDCRSLISITIPNSVTTIESAAIRFCTSLTSVTIPASVTSVGGWAFSECYSLKEVYCKATIPPTGGRDMFYYNASDRKIYVPASDDDRIIKAYKAKTYWSDYADCIFEEEPKPANNEIWYTATAKVEPYKTDEFGATYLSNVWDSETGEGVITFDGDVTKIGNFAFQGCKSLTSVTIGDSVTTIGEWAFAYCDSLTSVTIGDSVTTIGDYAFYSCDSLTSVTIPDSVTTIGEGAFYFCKSLKEFKGKFAADNGRCLIKDNTIIAYAEASGTTYTIPDSVTTIGNHAFDWCSSLTSVTIPDSVTTIGNYAFSDCESLTSVTIPDTVTTIGDYAFGYCTNLTSVTIGDSVTTIGEWAFAYCDSLTSVTIGDSVTTIGDSAFYSCDSLTSVTIPDSVTTIGEGAFYFCKSLKTVYCKPTTPPTGGRWMFDGNASERKIYVPSASVSTYKAAKYWSDYASNIFEEE